MEITGSLHSSHSPSISTKPFFSDQSHLVFYGCSSSTQCKPIKPRVRTPLASLRAAQPLLQSACQPVCNTDSSIPSEVDLLTELAVLKAQVKLKKKQLKAVAKERKTALKRQKTKAKGESSSSSSSSSSSDSSDGGSMAVDMRLLKKDSSQNMEGEGLIVRGESRGLCVDVDQTNIQQYRNEGIAQCLPSCGLSSSAERARSPVQAFQGKAIPGWPSHGAAGAGHERAISGSIEVCVGGKCKKAGSQQLLSSFKAQIPVSVSVDAVPCKCMGKCGAAVNVKVNKEDTNPQHHSHVSVDDVGFILSHHFGLGPPSSGLPCFASLSTSSIPSICAAQV